MKHAIRGALALALCLLTWTTLPAAPIYSPSDGSSAAYQSPVFQGADPYADERASVLIAAPIKITPDHPRRAPVDVAALTTASPAPPPVSLVLIGVAMVWIAGVIRYSLRR